MIEYISMATLLAVLLLLNAVEFFLTKQTSNSTRGRNLIIGAGWTFIGILLTLIIGFAADFTDESHFIIPLKTSRWFICVPLGFIINWGIHYWVGSKLLSKDIIETHFDTYYCDRIKEILEDSPSNNLSAVEILDKFYIIDVDEFYKKIIITRMRLNFLPSKKKSHKLMETFAMNTPRLTRLLGRMEGKEIGITSDGRYFRIPGHRL